MTNTILLKEYIEKSGLKKGYIAKKLGLSTYGLQLKVEGKSKFYAEQISTLCELLNITDLETKFMIFFAQDVENNSTN